MAGHGSTSCLKVFKRTLDGAGFAFRGDQDCLKDCLEILPANTHCSMTALAIIELSLSLSSEDFQALTAR
jgi:hypothetical protein